MYAVALAAVAFVPSLQPRILPSRKAVSFAAPKAATSRLGSRGPLLFVGPDDEKAIQQHKASAPATMYSRTPGGLSYKDLVIGDGGDGPSPENVYSIRFTATRLSTGEAVDGTGTATITVVPGALPLLDEAIAGMKVGGTRRVLVLPSSKWSVLEDETIEIEVDLVDVRSGFKAAVTKASGPLRSALGTAWNLYFFYLITSWFLELVGLVPPSGSASGAASVAAQSVDAANVWAAQGLQSVGLL